MQAIFRFNGSEEIEVWTSPGQVVLEKRYAPPQVCDSEHPADPANVVRTMVCLTKSQARSIASAMMQAAAEL
jgi:hypothetical protein